jgi:hypothetical protein
MSGASVVRGVIVFFIVWPERFVRLEFYLACVNATEPFSIFKRLLIAPIQNGETITDGDAVARSPPHHSCRTRSRPFAPQQS